jgi:hypothetical protein
MFNFAKIIKFSNFTYFILKILYFSILIIFFEFQILAILFQYKYKIKICIKTI